MLLTCNTSRHVPHHITSRQMPLLLTSFRFTVHFSSRHVIFPQHVLRLLAALADSEQQKVPARPGKEKSAVRTSAALRAAGKLALTVTLALSIRFLEFGPKFRVGYAFMDLYYYNLLLYHYSIMILY